MELIRKPVEKDANEIVRAIVKVPVFLKGKLEEFIARNGVKHHHHNLFVD